MRRSRLQFLQRMADWNLRSCNGMLVKSGWVVCWQPKDHNHNTSIWNIICSKHQSLFTQTVGFYWTVAFPFPNAWNISMPWSHLSHALVAGTGQSTAHSWLLWMFIFENYADPSLERHRRLIGMRPGTRFFTYGMNGLEILLQMPTSTHGLPSLAKITGIWQNMLPVCLSIGGFNVCSPGILLALDVWAVHETPGIQNLMRTADMRILDIGEMRHWTTAYGTHILIRL